MADDRRREILDALRAVVDPEIGIDVVDLGLVYGAEERDGHVHVVMAMTTPACPLGESIAEEANAAIRRGVSAVTSVAIDVVSEPPWRPSMMSTAARRRLGWT
jgi:metal-sulfur cluster biosynthetic enzyme